MAGKPQNPTNGPRSFQCLRGPEDSSPHPATVRQEKHSRIMWLSEKNAKLPSFSQSLISIRTSAEWDPKAKGAGTRL